MTDERKSLCSHRLHREIAARIACLGILAACLVMLGGCGEREHLVFVFGRQADPVAAQANADTLAAMLGEELGQEVRAQVPRSYGIAVQALVSETADVAYLDSLAFLMARRDGEVELLLAEVRPDAQGQKRTDYDSIFVVAADSDIQSMGDIIASASSLRIAFTSPTSTSGYLMAMRRLVNEGLLQPGEEADTKFAQVLYGGSYTQALELVARGQADVCAVSFYTMEGPRADVYLADEQRAQLRVAARTPGVPTHLIAVRSALSQETKDKIKQTLLKVSAEHSELLADVYGASELAEVDEDEHIRATVEAMQYIGRPVSDFVR